MRAVGVKDQSAVAALSEAFARIESQSRFLVTFTMTSDAMLNQNRPDMGLEEFRR